MPQSRERAKPGASPPRVAVTPMRSIIFWFICCVSSAHAAESIVAGEWSAPAHGLRGRLVSLEVKPAGETRIAHLYLELENVSDSLSPLLIDAHSPKVEVVDSTGKVLPQISPSEVDEWSPLPYTLVLPLGATIRLPISVSGWKIWIISNGGAEEKNLTGSFAIPELKAADIEGWQKDHKRGDVWRGTLILPKLKLPTSGN